MNYRSLLLVFLPLLVGGISFFVSNGSLSCFYARYLASVPIVDSPSQLDLGEREFGEIVVTPFTIRNNGRADLLLDQVQSNCSCTGMEQLADTEYTRIDSLRIKPGARADLVMRVTVQGVPHGHPMKNVVRFRTNDPSQPEVEIQAIVSRVKRGLICSPQMVAFGSLAVGEKKSQVVEIRDTSSPSRVLDKIESTDPDRLQVISLPFQDVDRSTGKSSEGTVIARIQVTFQANQPGPFEGKIQLHLKEPVKKPGEFLVMAQVVPRIEWIPSMLFLPRVSSSGPVYTAQCSLKCTTGKPVRVSHGSLPPGLTVDLPANAGSEPKIILIRWDPNKGKALAGRKTILDFQVSTDTETTTLPLPVILGE